VPRTALETLIVDTRGAATAGLDGEVGESGEAHLGTSAMELANHERLITLPGPESQEERKKAASFVLSSNYYNKHLFKLLGSSGRN
jgi:hypothetical protein